MDNTGLEVSRLCSGMMSYGTSTRRDWALDESRPFIQQALQQFSKILSWLNAGLIT